MDYLDLNAEYLQDAQNVMSFNPDIPLQYRILGKLNMDNDIHIWPFINYYVSIKPSDTPSVDVIEASSIGFPCWSYIKNPFDI